jgi:hypothetical protein
MAGARSKLRCGFSAIFNQKLGQPFHVTAGATVLGAGCGPYHSHVLLGLNAAEVRGIVGELAIRRDCNPNAGALLENTACFLGQCAVIHRPRLAIAQCWPTKASGYLYGVGPAQSQPQPQPTFLIRPTAMAGHPASKVVSAALQ